MIEDPLYNHPGWQWCTAEGAELHTLLLGLNSTFREKLIWLDEAENLTIAFQRCREQRANAISDSYLPTDS
ncbi:MAG: hypothetical protein HC767_05945 [Akkermansiaceae bacterium]|nr:hypothetical protein [Akkermansiaceae bacterium]